MRFYDPNTGRFTQLDPIGDGINWYAYAGGNPVGYVDPWGLRPDDRCENIQRMLEFEKKYGTQLTAQRFSNTWGKYKSGPLAWMGWGRESMGDLFDGKPIRSALGIIDLDWFADLNSFQPSMPRAIRWLPHAMAPARLDGLYIIGKTIWNNVRMLEGYNPASMNIIYQEQAERVALSATRRGLSFADLFPQDFLEKEMGCQKCPE